jgi:predicted transcriptional regulator
VREGGVRGDGPDGAPPQDGGGPGAAARRPAGTLEAEVLAVLRAAGTPLTAGQVRQRLTPGQRAELSYSTVVTICSRLHAKGLLARERAGRGFAYAPLDEAGVAAGRMRQVLDGGADRDAVLSRFASGLSGRDARLLRALLASQPGESAGEQE